MAVQKNKKTPSKRGMRRAHDRIGTGTYMESQETGELKLRHRMTADGFYRGRQVIKPRVTETAEVATPAAE